MWVVDRIDIGGEEDNRNVEFIGNLESRKSIQLGKSEAWGVIVN